MVKEFYTVKEFAKEIGFSVDRVYEWLRSGYIKHLDRITPHSIYRIPKTEADRVLGLQEAVVSKLPSGHIETKRNPVKVEAELKHSGDLLNLLGKLEAQVTEIYEKSPLGILRGGARVINWESRPLESWSYGGDKYPEEICKWKWKDSRTAEFQLDVEEDRLFKYLRQHLAGENIWRLYEDWKESFRQALEIFDHWERKNIDADLASVQGAITPIEGFYDNLMEEFLSIQQKRMLPGKCDCCPD